MVEKLEVVAAVLTREDGRVLACKRGPGRAAAGMWEFPGGKVEDGEDHRAALSRELREELSIETIVDHLMIRTQTAVGGLVIDLACYHTLVLGTEPQQSTDHVELRWMLPQQLDELDWAVPDRAAVSALNSGQLSP